MRIILKSSLIFFKNKHQLTGICFFIVSAQGPYKQKDSHIHYLVQVLFSIVKRLYTIMLYKFWCCVKCRFWRIILVSNSTKVYNLILWFSVSVLNWGYELLTSKAKINKDMKTLRFFWLGIHKITIQCYYLSNW